MLLSTVVSFYFHLASGCGKTKSKADCGFAVLGLLRPGCLDGWMDGWLFVCLFVCLDGWMDGWMDGWSVGWVVGWLVD